jgi:hypothetical protein
MRRAVAFAGERRWSVALGRGAERFHRRPRARRQGSVEVELAAKGRARLERLLVCLRALGALCALDEWFGESR